MHAVLNRRYCLVAFLSLSVIAFGPVPAGAQLINGSFDAGGGSLTGWSTFNNSIPNVLAAPITPYDGTHVAKVFGGFNGSPNYSGLLQNQPASLGQFWRASAHVRHNSDDSLVGTANRLILKIEFYRVPDGAYGTDDMLLEIGTPVLDANSELDNWIAHDLQALAPPQTVEARIALVFEQINNATGAALIDDIAFESDDESPPEGELLWADEFEGGELNPANWEPMIGDGTLYGTPPGWGNNELQFYTDRPENVFVAGGLLHIVAREESYAGYGYTSARLRSSQLQDFLYGRMEARIKLPGTQGTWPAFWMLPTDWVYGGWAASGELDIMEAVNIPTTVFGTIHYGGSWPNNTSSGGTYADGTDYSQDFHTYSIHWRPDQIRWYVDDLLYHIEASQSWYSDGAPGDPDAPFDQLFHFLLNVAVGGNFPGPPGGSSEFPQEMLVDWVRVYSSPPSCIGDLNSDSVVDAADLGALLGSWGTCEGCSADLNEDGVVNAADLAALLGHWGPCR